MADACCSFLQCRYNFRPSPISNRLRYPIFAGGFFPCYGCPKRLGSLQCSRKTIDCSSTSCQWDWNRWNLHFTEIEKAESSASILKSLLSVAIRNEDFHEAASLKTAIEKVEKKAYVAEAMSQLKIAINEERYHDASSLCKCTGSGLVGWWVGYPLDTNDPFGRVIHISPRLGRFIAKSYTPRQLMDACPGTPLFEIFLVKDANGSYVMQVVYLQQDEMFASGSANNASTDENIFRGNELEKPNKHNSGVNEGVRSLVNFLKSKIPVLKAAFLNLSSAEEMVTHDDKKSCEENSQSQTEETVHKQSLDGDFYLDAFFSRTLKAWVDDHVKDAYVRLPAEIKDLRNDSFILHVPDPTSQNHARELGPLDANTYVETSSNVHPDFVKAMQTPDIFSSKVSKDVREVVKLLIDQLQKYRNVSERTVFCKISSRSNSMDPFDGLYIGEFGPYGVEVIQLRRRRGNWNESSDKSSSLEESFEFVEAVKLTGDLNVPAGEVAFRARVGAGSCIDNRFAYPSELGVIASYKGQGKIADYGFQNAQWVDGELLYLKGNAYGHVKGNGIAFLYMIPGQSFVLLFNKLNLLD